MTATPPTGTPAVSDQPEGYRTESWRGLPNFVCDKEDGFSTLDENYMREHQILRHGAQLAEDNAAITPPLPKPGASASLTATVGNQVVTPQTTTNPGGTA